MYNKNNYLNRVKAVNEIYKQYTAKGYSNEWIFKNLIKDKFFISRSTFYTYLSIPYKRELERTKARENE